MPSSSAVLLASIRASHLNGAPCAPEAAAELAEELDVQLAAGCLSPRTPSSCRCTWTRTGQLSFSDSLPFNRIITITTPSLKCGGSGEWVSKLQWLRRCSVGFRLRG